ncbi:zinc ribbon domain-containing protein [bacterium]|nr:MAG: zinc ribbon domain-containing protein [bacterium]
MPVFEYRCKKCDEKFEQLVFSAKENVECPRCGNADNEKLISVFASKHSHGAAASPSVCSSSGSFT